MRKLIALVKLGRMLFLTGGFILYGLGAAVAHYEGYTIDLSDYLWGQVIVTLTQLMVHFSNDYFDYEHDLVNLTPSYWSGGSRILIRGELPRQVGLIAALICGGLATSLTVLLAVVRGDTLIVFIFGAAIFGSWSYSAPPLQLHVHSLGEVVGSVILAFLTPLCGFYIQAETISPLLFLAVAPLLLMQFNMLLSVHIPDAEGDAKSGKRTLVVCYGKEKIAALYGGVLIAAYLLLPLLLILGLPPLIVVAVLIPSPLGVWLLWRMRCGDWNQPKRWGWLAFFSIGLLMNTALLQAIFFSGILFRFN